MRTVISDSDSMRSGVSNAKNRSLSQASLALEISSLRKISRFEYKECTIRCSSCLTSVWNPKVSSFAVIVLITVSVLME